MLNKHLCCDDCSFRNKCLFEVEFRQREIQWNELGAPDCKTFEDGSLAVMSKIANNFKIASKPTA